MTLHALVQSVRTFDATDATTRFVGGVLSPRAKWLCVLRRPHGAMRTGPCERVPRRCVRVQVPGERGAGAALLRRRVGAARRCRQGKRHRGPCVCFMPVCGRVPCVR